MRLGAAALVLAAACWSDRAGVTAPSADAPCRASLSPLTAGAVVVLVQDFAFRPATVRVPPGGRVAWVNCGGAGDVAHTSTADGGGWSSGSIASGGVFVQTFDTPGTFAYHCEPHPFMTGSVTVE